MADPAWLEVRAVLRCDPELVDTVRAWLEESDLVEVNRVDVVHLDGDLRRWDGGRPPGVVADAPDLRAVVPLAGRHSEAEPLETRHPVFDDLRRGLHLHEQ